MCGIVGYAGRKNVLPILLDGLKRLEYRGYDSAGVAWLVDGEIKRVRAEGKLLNLADALEPFRGTGSHTGIAHTRWATHGAPNEANAHPHTDCSGEIVVVHNGIIENYFSLREGLMEEGHEFRSETDTEVLAHLIEKYLDDDLVKAVRRALSDVKGAFAMGVMWQHRPDTLVAVRKQSPLVLGIGENESFMASDIPALLPYTKDVVFLNDGDLAVLSSVGVHIMDFTTGEHVQREVKTIYWDAAMAEKAGYRHFMLKEIFEQPQSIANTFRGRVDLETGTINIPELEGFRERISEMTRIILLACGTSWHAGMVARYWFEKWFGVPVEVELASEFRYRQLVIDRDVLVIPISQSGETADTLAGMAKAREAGAMVVSICNVVGSSVTRESDATVYTHAGPEISVASTKAFTSQLTALYVTGLWIASARGNMSGDDVRDKVSPLLAVPDLLEKNLELWREQAASIAQEYYTYNDFLFLGRDVNFPVALEGALKLKEISYIHAEGYAAGEMKHGPIALIDHNMPVVAIAPRDHVYEKVVSNIEEVRSRKGIIIAVGDEGAEELERIANSLMTLPHVNDSDIAPFICTVPLQLLAYETACMKGCDVDQPRNLAKSVTVE